MPELTTADVMTVVDVDQDYIPGVDTSETPDELKRLTPAVLLGEVLKSLRTLADPGGDHIPFWDESANAAAWLQIGTGLNITGTFLNSDSGISIGNEINDAGSFNDIITIAGGDSGTIYHGIITTDFPISTSYAVPSNMFLAFTKGAMITDGGGGEIDFEGVGLLDPLSQPGCPYFSGFAAGDITWSSTSADERPAAISTELWDTGNNSLSDRLSRANEAFGDKQIRIDITVPRTITGNTAVEFYDNTEIVPVSGDYPNTFSHTTGNHAPFGHGNNFHFHGPRSAVFNESTGTFGCRIIQPNNTDTDLSSDAVSYTDVIIEGVTFKGHPSAVSDGSGATVYLGNCQNSAIRYCKFENVHNYAAQLGGQGSDGNYAYNSEISDNLFIKAQSQAIAFVNTKNCKANRNFFSATLATFASGALIDLEPNSEDDFMEDVFVEGNDIIVLDDWNGTNTVGGIAFQPGGLPHIKGAVCRNNTIWGMHPSDYVPTTSDTRLGVGFVWIGVIDGIFENNTVRYANACAFQFNQCRRITAKNNHTTGVQDSAGQAASMRVVSCADSHFDFNIFKEVTDVTSSTGIFETELFFSATSSGSNLTITPLGTHRFFSFHKGLNIFYNGTEYTIYNPGDAIAHIASATDVDFGTNVFTKTAHGYDNGEILRYQAGTTEIGGLQHGQFVYVVNKNANDFQIAATEGGSAINITSAGTGTQIFVPYGLNTTTQVLRTSTSIGTVAVKTFAHTAVDTTANTITITAHGYQTGAIVKLTTPGTLPSISPFPAAFALDGIQHWYVIRIDADTIKLADTLANAIALSASDITTQGSGTITITPEVQTRFSSNYYRDNFVPDGLSLAATGTSEDLSSAGGAIGGDTGANDNRMLRSDGTGGATVQASSVVVDDSGNFTGVTHMTGSGNGTFNSFAASGADAAGLGFAVFTGYGIGVGSGTLKHVAGGSGHQFMVNGTDEAARVDNSSTATHTRFLIYDVDNGTLERVTVGAADSGGSGFKVLRIPN